MTDQSVDKEKKALRYTRLNETKAFFFFLSCHELGMNISE